MGYQILVCLAGLAAGILIACGIPGVRLLYYLGPPGLVGLWYLFAGQGWRLFTRVRIMGFLMGFVCFFSCGWVSVVTTTFRKAGSPPFKAEIRGRVVSYREVTERMGQLVVDVRQEYADGRWLKKRGRVVLLVKPQTPAAFHRGEWWSFGPLLFTQVSDKPSKTGFVPSRYWISRGVRYEARPAAGAASMVARGSPGLAGFFQRWQETLSERINRIPMSEASGALVRAMILGDRSDVDKETMNDFSRAGIIHVLSVSGLHVGIIYFLIAWILRRFALVGPIPRSLIALLVVWAYTGLTGFSPSALRAAGMITLFEAARIGRRGTPPLWILTATALIHCLADPYSLFNAGAQLSYLAVAGIFVWNPVFNPMLSGFNRAVRYFGGSLTLSLAAQSLTLPLLLFWFGWFPLYFLLGNLVLLPLMVFGFYFGLGITIFSFTGITFLPACKAMDLLVAAVTAGSRWLGNLPGNLVRPEGLIWPDLVLYYLILFSLRAYLDKPLPGRIRNLLLLTGMLLICRILLKIA